ncbi:Magnesium-chelatase subunit chlI, chloroplastic [Glycine soja]|nr:Magnesium-chelatase subunit chlI, chloroplastic [Glycine soja]
MASTFGASSITFLSSRYYSSQSLATDSPSLTTVQIFGRKFCGGGNGFHGVKGRSLFPVASVVATQLNSAQQAQKIAFTESQRPVYPFSAIVGQDEMKLCLLLNVIDPKIGGVMIMGDRGTGKSTTVRSLVDLLPEIKVVAGDPYNSDPEDPEFMGVEVRERNPEEGELRPQLLDRFGMHAQVGTVRDAELRVKIVEERARFDKNPKVFRDSYKAEQQNLQQQIASARSFLSSVQIDRNLKVKISKVCAELNVDGLRGDIVTNRAAKALAALKGRDKVSAEDIATVIPNCLRHRLRKDPLESIDSGLLVLEKFYEVFR